MFSLLDWRMAYIPLDNPNSRILDKFETAKGTEIENEQILIRMTPLEASNRRDSHSRRFPTAQRRYDQPNGIYNCHGMVFGARRTGIHSSSVMKIIDEDDYKKVEPPNPIMAGDIVLYFSEGDVEHTAIVVEPPRQGIFLPLVVSKWGDFVEYVHYANNCPYDSSNLLYYRAIP